MGQINGECPGSVQACRLRVARLEPNGVPDPGAENLYVSDAMIRLSAEPEVSEGEDLEQKNGCGDIIVAYRSPDAYKHINVELEIAHPDPELIELIAGGAVLKLGDDTVGYKYPAMRTAFNENGVSVEAWSKAIVDGQLATIKPYHRWVLGKVRNWQIGQRELQNDILATVLSGQAIDNPNWHDGPANDWYDLTDDDYDTAFAHVRDVGLPEASCGYQTLAAS